MDITKAVSEIRQTLGEGLTESVSNTLTQVRNEFVTMQDSLKMTNEEAKTRRQKNAELLSEVEILKDQVSNLSDDSELKQLKSENEVLKQVKEKYETTTKKKYLERLQEIQSAPNFEKIKDKIKIPEIKEEKFVPESVNFEEAENSLNKLDEYISLGLFEQSKTQKPLTPSGKIMGASDDDNVDIVELARTNPEEAKKYFARKGMALK